MNPTQLRKQLLIWYAKNKRDLPWRRKPTLYKTILSEFMLQQTRVDQALPYFHRFLKAFPSFTALAKAPEQKVLKLWEGLGYYRRARFLHATAKVLAGKRKITVDLLSDCPGIGPYCLAAIGSIALGEPLPVVDGNVKRVISRLLALKDLPDSKTGKVAIMDVLEKAICHKYPGDFNQAVMELGATVCTPKKPLCMFCPVQKHCAGFKTGKPEAFPKVAPKAKRPHHEIGAAVIRRKKDKRILITQRPEKGLLGNLWEFPGGKQEKGETLEQCTQRELKEEINIHVKVGKKLCTVKHGYTHFTINLHVFDCLYQSGRIQKKGVQDYKWVKIKELKEYPFPRSNWPMIEQLLRAE